MTTPTDDTGTSATPPTPPLLTGRDIGAAARATSALLDPLLAEANLPFAQWTVLFTLAGTGPLTRSALVQRQADGLKVPESTAQETVDGMVTAGLIAPTDDARLAPTVTGQAIYQPIRDEVNRIAVELYGDLPPADLETTRRTLEEVTRRASARLARGGATS
jgi:DNA-binding MarR family transcriptional regulator